MGRRLWWRGCRSAAVVAIGALALTSCASADGQDSDNSSSAGEVSYSVGYVGDREAGTPVSGGSVTFGSYGFPATLDPTTTLVAGMTGGTELAAIYDSLVRYDPEAGEFVPQLAESLESGDGGATWTVKLREGTKFSDGTTMDSAAVKWSFDRYVAAKRDVAQLWANSVASVETPDATTVVIKLQEPWIDFPVLLSTGPGVIVAPSSMAGGTFTPIGAGPFSVVRFAPNEALELAPREDYVGGKPYLDSLRFVPMPSARAMVESVQSGVVNSGFILRESEAIDELLDNGYSGFLDIQGAGAVGQINAREGRPGADPRVRRAIALAIDPEALNQRASQGLNPWGSTLYPPESKWYNPDVPGVQYDPEAARKLLDEAKADGYDGKLTYVAINEESARGMALAVQAALNSVGFDVTIDYATSVTDITKRVYIDRDYDMARGGTNLMDVAPYMRLYTQMGSDSPNNSAGFDNAEMDQLLAQLKSAPDEAAQQKVIDEIQTLANETVPYAVWAPSRVYVAWDPDVHGVNVSTDGIALFDKAWVSE